jgi:hypothetical protein
MKKQILKAFLVLAIVASASTAMAGATIVGTVTIGAGNTFTPSTKVGINIMSTSTSYAAAGAHLNGTKEYGTVGGSGLAAGQDPSKIYSKDIPSQVATATVGAPTTQTDATQLVGTGWL